MPVLFFICNAFVTRDWLKCVCYDKHNGLKLAFFCKEGEGLGWRWDDAVAVLESYGVKVISYEYDALVKNTYK